jgi:hypothetical protein
MPEIFEDGGMFEYREAWARRQMSQENEMLFSWMREVPIYYTNEETTMPLGKDEIENRFGFHKATIEGPEATLPKHREVRILFREFAERLDGILGDGRAKSTMFTHLEDASMWSHKAIAEGAPLISE